MVFRNTEGVGTALDLTAAVQTLPHSFSQLEAYLGVVTVEIAVTATFSCATFAQIIGIPDVTWWTNTLTLIAIGSRTASDFLAYIFTSASLASVSRGAQNAFVTVAIFAVLANASLDLRTHDERISGVAFFAATIVTSYGVDANGTLSTHVVITFVDIVTADERISREA